jgi:eukaryotic-like serine/threonine-protein kinase
VSPQNVLISYEGDIKLCDFGIAKAVAKASKTQMGALKGKLQYMSPEQAWGRVVDSRSDIFSLGAVLYTLCAGEKPFPGDTFTSVAYKVVHTAPLPVRELNPALPEQLDGILGKCLAKDPAERYSAADVLAGDLEILRATLPVADAAAA